MLFGGCASIAGITDITASEDAAAIIDRLNDSLTQCLPEKLPQPADAGGEVPCLVLATLANVPNVLGSDACTNTTMYPSLQPVDPTVLAEFQAGQHAAYVQGATSVDYSLYQTCQIQQLAQAHFAPAGSCLYDAASAPQGWCYLTNGGQCAQELVFSPEAIPQSAIVTLECLEGSSLAPAN